MKKIKNKLHTCFRKALGFTNPLQGLQPNNTSILTSILLKMFDFIDFECFVGSLYLDQKDINRIRVSFWSENVTNK